MDKIQKYEKVLINLYWVFIVLLLTEITVRLRYHIDADVIIKQRILLGVFIGSLAVFNLFKIIYMKRSKTYSQKTFDLFRTLEVVLFSASMFSFHDVLEFIILIVPFIFTCYQSNKRHLYILMAVSLILKIAHIFIWFTWFDNGPLIFNIVMVVCIYVLIIALLKVNTQARNRSIKNEMENDRLILELGEKYEQLTAAQNEIKNQYDKLKDTNHMLEQTNRRLTSSIAEFYTLQQISEAIGSIFDITELLKFVNDVILGVMGVHYSTIAIYDQKKNRLKVQITNITNKEDIAILKGNINCEMLLNILENEFPIMENMVIPERYDFIKTRQIGSLICIPLISKSRKFGLTLIEHKNYNYFNEENLRLLKTISKQVSIAIENAELYEKMQELATIDGLTGVYNRVYFREKFESEYKLSKQLGYNLSLALLDIDLFKKFNDTYGHLFGDVVLKSVAQTIKNSLRGKEMIARFGGEEFIIIFPNTTTKEAFERVEFLRNEIANNIISDNNISASVTASFGIACFPETSVDDVSLIRDADNALYKAKESGRNCIRIASKY